VSAPYRLIFRVHAHGDRTEWPGTALGLDYNSDELSALSPPVPGDLNFDNIVCNVLDYLGRTTIGCKTNCPAARPGDANGNGVVNVLTSSWWRATWLHSSPPSGGGAVGRAEPSTWLLLGMDDRLVDRSPRMDDEPDSVCW